MVLASLLANAVLGYVGPGAGLEFIPFFLGLLAWLGTAVGAALLWPLYVVMRRFRRGKDAVETTPAKSATDSLHAEAEMGDPPVT